MVYYFKPMPDITAYELSMILSHLGHRHLEVRLAYDGIEVSNGSSIAHFVTAIGIPGAERHFTTEKPE